MLHAPVNSRPSGPLSAPERHQAIASGLGAFSKSNSRLARQGSPDPGNNQLQTALSLRPYLQGFSRPGANRSLRNATGRSDPDYYRLFDQPSGPTFQGNGSLLIACNLTNRSTAPISITQLSRSGARIPGSAATVQPGQAFNYPNVLGRGTFYLKITSAAPGENRYLLNLPIINS